MLFQAATAFISRICAKISDLNRFTIDLLKIISGTVGTSSSPRPLAVMMDMGVPRVLNVKTRFPAYVSNVAHLDVACARSLTVLKTKEVTGSVARQMLDPAAITRQEFTYNATPAVHVTCISPISISF